MRLSVVCLACSSLLSGSAFAGPFDPVPVDAEGPSIVTEDPWKFELRPYLWTVSLEGDIGINGIVTPVDLSFGTIIDNLDFAGAATFIARKGKWSFFLEGNYLKMSVGIDDVPFQLFNSVGIEVEQLLMVGGVFYRVAEWDRGFFDVGFGAQYMYVRNQFDLSLNAGGVAALGDRLAAQAVDRAAAQIRKEVQRRLASITPPPPPSGKPFDRLVDRISKGVDGRSTERGISDALSATTANSANSDLGNIGATGPIKDKIQEVIRARVEEQIAVRTAGLKSAAARKAAAARKKAERSLSRAIQNQVKKTIPDSIEVSESWVDPFVAARARHFLTDRIYLNVFGSWGGGGV